VEIHQAYAIGITIPMGGLALLSLEEHGCLGDTSSRVSMTNSILSPPLRCDIPSGFFPL